MVKLNRESKKENKLHLSLFEPTDFEAFWELESESKIMLEENHAPYGKHTHHFQVIILKKTI